MQHTRLLTRSLAALVACAASLPAQPAMAFTVSSWTRARQVLDRGIDALGGLNAFRLVDDIHYVSNATVTEIGQSAGPEAAYYLRPLRSEGYVDFRNKRYVLVQHTNYIGSGERASSIVTTERSGFTVDLRSNALYPLATGAQAAANAGVQRLLPHLILQAALRRANTLRSLGTAQHNGRAQDVIDFTDADGSKLTLFFDAGTGVLTKTEGLSDRLLEGLTGVETLFTDYRTVSGVRVPFHAESRIAGRTTTSVSYNEIAFNVHPDSARFSAPADATIGPEVGGPNKPLTLTTLGRDVYYVDAIETGGIFFYSAMFVVFSDYVLVVEAPLSDNVSQIIIAKIKETAPGKPIRYVVATHYHTDHTGGIRGYVAEGSTIITTPGNRGFFERLAAVAHPLNRDRLSQEPRAPAIETVAQKRVFTDGDHVVELYSLGPTSHADEMLVAYLPREKLAFVSDVFLVSYKGGNGAAEPSTITFYDRVRQLHLDITTIAGGHGRLGTFEELKEAVARSRG